jgi:hypothetical protein
LYGVSVEHPLEVIAALESGTPQVIQVPVSAKPSGPMRAALQMAKKLGVGIIGRELLYGGKLVRQSLERLALITASQVVGYVVGETLRSGLVDAVVLGCRTRSQVTECCSMSETTLDDGAVLDRLKVAVQNGLPASWGVVRREPADRYADLDWWLESEKGWGGT